MSVDRKSITIQAKIRLWSATRGLYHVPTVTLRYKKWLHIELSKDKNTNELKLFLHTTTNKKEPLILSKNEDCLSSVAVHQVIQFGYSPLRGAHNILSPTIPK